MYAFPAAALVVFAGLALYEYVDTRRATWGAAFFGLRRSVMNRTLAIDGSAVVLGFFVVAATYVHVVGTALELAENYRYRFLVEPLFFVVTAAAVTDAVRWVRAKLEVRKASLSA